MLAAGSVVSTTLVYRGEGEAVAGVALFKFEPRSLKITSLTFYRAGD
jgi:hypothetical protein